MREINITADYIKFGQPCEHHACPIAMALIDEGAWQEVNVGADRIWLDGERYQMSPHIMAWIRDFDFSDDPDSSHYRGVPSPFTLVLDEEYRECEMKPFEAKNLELVS